jgi:hypothetical protein
MLLYISCALGVPTKLKTKSAPSVRIHRVTQEICQHTSVSAKQNQSGSLSLKGAIMSQKMSLIWEYFNKKTRNPKRVRFLLGFLESCFLTSKYTQFVKSDMAQQNINFD